jgi:hypothetical protein
MHRWLAENGYTRQQPPVSYVTDGWEYFMESERFALDPPGRLRYFRFVALENRLSRPLETWKLAAYNYVTALSALFFGYARREQMYQWRGRMLALFQGLFGKLLRP